MRGVVLCAGFGTRLAPLTDVVPKPLVPVANRPVLELVLERLAAAGLPEVGINLHHKAPLIEAWLAGRGGRLPVPRVVFEPEILDTGGGIAHFREWGDGSPPEGLVVHNADVVTDIDIEALVAVHREHDAEATVALVDHAETNVVRVDGHGVIRDIRGRLGADPGQGTLRTFSGVYVLSPRFLARLEPGRRSSVVDAMRAAVAERPGSVRGVVQPDGVFWRDLGNVPSYLHLHEEILVEGRLGPLGRGACAAVGVPAGGVPTGSPGSAGVPGVPTGSKGGAGVPGVPTGSPGSAVCVHPGARVHPDARLEGFVAIGEGAVIGRDVRLVDCVVWPGTRLDGPLDARRTVFCDTLEVKG